MSRRPAFVHRPAASVLQRFSKDGLLLRTFQEGDRINWFAQSTEGGSQLITLNGHYNGTNIQADGLQLEGSNCIVSGLVIGSFEYNGIEADGNNDTIGGTTSGAGNLSEGNAESGIYLAGSGTVVQGNTLQSNSYGVNAVFTNSTIGGTTLAARNLINRNDLDDVRITGTGIVVQGNYIGTDGTSPDGTAHTIGVDIKNSNNTIGGTTLGAGNVISGQSGAPSIAGIVIELLSGKTSLSGVVIQGNFIGTDATGTKSIGNPTGILASSGVSATIGGTAAGAGNVISGNTQSGIYNQGSLLIQGNYIGTDYTGSKALGNGVGIDVEGNGTATIGGTGAAARNIISGSQGYFGQNGDGILLGGAGALVEGNFIGTDRTGESALSNSTCLAPLAAAARDSQGRG